MSTRQIVSRANMRKKASVISIIASAVIATAPSTELNANRGVNKTTSNLGDSYG